MPIITLKPFQKQAVESAVAVFDHMRSILDTAGVDEQEPGDGHSRQRVSID